MRLVVFSFVLLLLAGCESSPLVPVASGGTDGVIIMSATGYSWQEIDWMASEHVVLGRCRAWNYSNFEAFDLVSSRCVSSSTYNSCAAWEYDSIQGVSNCVDYEPVQRCSIYQFDRSYQCVGRLDD